MNLSGNPSRFNWTGGRLDFTSGLVLSSPNDLGSSSTLSIGKTLENDGSLTNNSQLYLAGGQLSALGTTTNNGLISGGGTIAMSSANFTNAGVLALSGLDMIGTNSITNNSNAEIMGNGTINVPVTNSGLIEVDGLPLSINSLTNSGIVQLGAPAASLQGGGITNNLTGIIQGQGLIGEPVTNNGVTRAIGGTLILAGTFTNSGAIDVPENATVVLTSGQPTLGGQVQLQGGELDVGVSTFGGIMTGRGTFRDSQPFFNTNTMQFSAGFTDIFGSLSNTGKIVITGGSTTTFLGNLTNLGSITIDTASTGVFLGTVSGASSISGPGTKDFEGAFSGGALSTVIGNTIIGPAASGSTDFFNENAVTVFGSAKTLTGTSHMNTLSITGGTLDLASNDLTVTSTPISTIAGYIQSAYNGGSWNAAGLGSSSAQAAAASGHKTALGYATASSLGISIFDGQPVSGSTVLVKYTYSGDANLDGKVNAQDFDALASHYGAISGDVWTQGDFNYDGVVNTVDFNALAANFNQQLSSPAASLGTLVPEPMMPAALLCGAMVARRSRRR